MSEASQHHVYFAVFGFGEDPGVVTRMMGIEPTKAWVKGEAMGGRGGVRTHSRWVLQSRRQLGDGIESHFDDLLGQLERRREAIADVCSRYEAGLAVAAYWAEANPGFCLSAPLIQRIAALGLEVDFDFYVLGAGENEC